MQSILIIEDDKSLREELSILLKDAGYHVERIEDFSDTLSIMIGSNADLILLDISLPEENGESLLKSYRKTKDTPVIMLTSRTTEVDEVLSFSFGANDYITKPYNPTILLLRISTVLRNIESSPKTIHYRDALISVAKGSITKGDKEQVLTKNEMIIFQLLLEHQGEIVTRGALMTALWNNDEYLNDNALSVNVSRLRTKLDDFGYKDVIETRKKLGYILK